MQQAPVNAQHPHLARSLDPHDEEGPRRVNLVPLGAVAVDRLDRRNRPAADAAREGQGLGSVAAARDACAEYDVLLE